MNGNQIADQGAQYLSDVLQNNMVKSVFYQSLSYLFFYYIQTLITLDLKYNKIRSEGIQTLGIALQNNTVIKLFYFFISSLYLSIIKDSYYTESSRYGNW